MKNIFIGIDFSKKTFDATMIRERQECNEPLGSAKFDNTRKGYKSFLRWAKDTSPCPKDEWLICGESTGAYSEGLAQWAYSKNLDVWIENPYSIKYSQGLVRGKDDRTDSMRIATYAQQKKRQCCLYKPLEGILRELKVLVKKRDILEKCRRMMNNAISEDRELYAADAAVQEFYERIQEITATIKELEKDIQNRMDAMAKADEEISTNYSIVCSFKGISVINAVAMLVYTDNFRKYPTANKMATAWGVAPFGCSSGTSIHKPSRVSHMCNHWLNAMLSCAANAAIVHDQKMGDYYRRLIERGKPKGVAYNNVKSKIIHIIFRMIETQQLYDPYYDVRKSDNKAQTQQIELN